MAKLRTVPSVRFEIYLPVSYIDRETGQEEFLQISDVSAYIAPLTAKLESFGGYSISNPYAAPSIAGGFHDEPQERNYWLMFLVPDQKLPALEPDVKAMISFFQKKYNQHEIFTK